MGKAVRRVFVEKKEGFTVEADILYKELKEVLGIKGLQGVKIVNRYDIEGISDEVYEKARNTIFAEPPVDNVYDEDYAIPEGYKLVAVEYLPGQYDQKADATALCIQLFAVGRKPEVRCAKYILLEGDISPEEFEKIKNYCINPLEAREAVLAKPETLELQEEYPEEVGGIDAFTAMNKEELKSLHEKMGLAMTLADLEYIQDYFRSEDRDPTITEIRVLDTYWSDHCRHTTFLTELDNISFQEGFYKPVMEETYKRYLESREKLYDRQEKPVSLMDIATIGMKELRKKGLLADLDESDEINACSIKIKVDVDGKEEDWLLMFKNETHNHPTEIEPFGGAATCLGGAIRDPLSGRSYVYQAMRITGSADPRTPVSETLPGKLPQRKITTGAARGYSSYGNQIGLTAGQVAEIYHENYVAKRMELGAVIAAAPAENVVRKKPGKGDVIVLLGGRTGRDGCGGATGSSREQDEESLYTCGAEVQKGNPAIERKIQRLFRKKEVSTMIKKCNDFGAGGVSVAIGELADGLDIDLDRVPTKYAGLDGTELAISESQERMAVVLEEADLERFLQEAEKENLEATPVAVVTDSGRLRMKWRGKTIVDISRDFLNTSGAPQKAEVTVQAPEGENYLRRLPEMVRGKLGDIKKAWLDNLQSLNTCSQKGLVERFDSTIGAATVFLPFGGETQLTPVDGMVAKIPVEEGETSTVSLMTYGYDPELAMWSPFHGAVYALVHSIAKSAALGGNYKNIRLTLQEYFERLGQDPERWGKPFIALLGSYLVQSSLGIPAIGGKDSMSGTFKDLDVPPTLVSFAVNTASAYRVVSPEFKRKDSKVLLISLERDKYDLPVFSDLEEKYSKIHELINKGDVLAASAVGYGGIAAAISRMAFGNNIGFSFSADFVNTENWPEKLFLPEYGSIILELAPEAETDGLPEYVLLGETIEMAEIRIEDSVIKLEEAVKAWMEPLESVFPAGIETAGYQAAEEIQLYRGDKGRRSVYRTVKPRVLIPVFPFTTNEYDLARQFRKAGADVGMFVFRDLTPAMLRESFGALIKEINNSRILVLSGGLSLGDEPAGSGKYIATVFRNPAVSEAVMELLEKRDGLILGISGGFQALLKLGLLPYGEIREIGPDSPSLSFNPIGRHVSTMARTRVVSTLSPWLALTEPDSEYLVPVSHSEGRFVAGEEILKEMIKKGQIATQYVDPSGKTAQSLPYNPYGSVMGIEGISSPDGRILGKMGHSERIGRYVARNIPGEKDQKLFEAAVAYFK